MAANRLLRRWRNHHSCCCGMTCLGSPAAGKRNNILFIGAEHHSSSRMKHSIFLLALYPGSRHVQKCSVYAKANPGFKTSWAYFTSMDFVVSFIDETPILYYSPLCVSNSPNAPSWETDCRVAHKTCIKFSTLWKMGSKAEKPLLIFLLDTLLTPSSCKVFLLLYRNIDGVLGVYRMNISALCVIPEVKSAV